ncbi:MAG: MTH1187 family thiamine-binding protein [Candidatus Bipolaricaulaceae bacterium]
MIVCEFSIVPLGAGESLSSPVSECVRLVEESGLPYQLTPMGTIVEGGWEEAMAVVARCHRRMRAKFSRVLTTVRIDDRDAPPGRLRSKVNSVKDKLAQSQE